MVELLHDSSGRAAYNPLILFEKHGYFIGPSKKPPKSKPIQHRLDLHSLLVKILHQQLPSVPHKQDHTDHQQQTHILKFIDCKSCPNSLCPGVEDYLRNQQIGCGLLFRGDGDATQWDSCIKIDNL
jgi:hypothetical protein